MQKQSPEGKARALVGSELNCEHWKSASEGNYGRMTGPTALHSGGVNDGYGGGSKDTRLIIRVGYQLFHGTN